MCPVCLTTVALMVGGATSSSGVAALSAKLFMSRRARRNQSRSENQSGRSERHSNSLKRREQN
jgi:hypothetical protein